MCEFGKNYNGVSDSNFSSFMENDVIGKIRI